jgi:hypothetical protein
MISIVVVAPVLAQAIAVLSDVSSPADIVALHGAAMASRTGAANTSAATATPTSTNRHTHPAPRRRPGPVPRRSVIFAMPPCLPARPRRFPLAVLGRDQPMVIACYRKPAVVERPP